ncbi:hypothetical protein F5Y16DRAFT_118648 [Xylariaceae sp. FL0255]|nr:hypothetical protein F5Y16DRAFT_118648 [Xylariaceae sp. FL0255]
MGTEAAERLEAELELLFAMYPESLHWSPKARELKYAHISDDATQADTPISLLLRIPDAYPVEGFPQVISATGKWKEDLRTAATERFRGVEASTPASEEVIDALLLTFEDLVSGQVKPAQQANAANDKAGVDSHPKKDEQSQSANRTVVIWLHHLLNTNKRKLALNPSVESAKISGITKPGYPGVLIFSGERSAVNSHISELRKQKWQAFQIRFDSDGFDREKERKVECWSFAHGKGIREVESMSDVTQDIVGEEEREVFLSCIGVK